MYKTTQTAETNNTFINQCELNEDGFNLSVLQSVQNAYRAMLSPERLFSQERIERDDTQNGQTRSSIWYGTKKDVTSNSVIHEKELCAMNVDQQDIARQYVNVQKHIVIDTRNGNLLHNVTFVTDDSKNNEKCHEAHFLSLTMLSYTNKHDTTNEFFYIKVNFRAIRALASLSRDSKHTMSEYEKKNYFARIRNEARILHLSKKYDKANADEIKMLRHANVVSTNSSFKNKTNCTRKTKDPIKSCVTTRKNASKYANIIRTRGYAHSLNYREMGAPGCVRCVFSHRACNECLLMRNLSYRQMKERAYKMMPNEISASIKAQLRQCSKCKGGCTKCWKTFAHAARSQIKQWEKQNNTSITTNYKEVPNERPRGRPTNRISDVPSFDIPLAYNHLSNNIVNTKSPIRIAKVTKDINYPNNAQVTYGFASPQRNEPAFSATWNLVFENGTSAECNTAQLLHYELQRYKLSNTVERIDTLPKNFKNANRALSLQNDRSLLSIHEVCIQFVGNRVAKVFYNDEQLCNELYHGTVVECVPEEHSETNEPFWSVRYDDGDSEDLDIRQLTRAIAVQEAVDQHADTLQTDM